MVKVASETITASSFYDRYFKLVTRYLASAGSSGSDEAALAAIVDHLIDGNPLAAKVSDRPGAIADTTSIDADDRNGNHGQR